MAGTRKLQRSCPEPRGKPQAQPAGALQLCASVSARSDWARAPRMAEPRQPLGIRKEGTGVICGSPTPLWRFPAETYKRGSSSIDPEILAWLRPAKLKRRKIKPAAVDQSWEAVERAVQMRLNNLAKTPRRPPMMKPRMTPHTLATDEATRGRDDAARHARQEEADRRLAQRLQRAEETAAAERGSPP